MIKRFKVIIAVVIAVTLLTVIGANVVTAQELNAAGSGSAATPNYPSWSGNAWCYGDDDDGDVSPNNGAPGGFGFNGGFCH
jgi:hypothetical protein